MRPFIRTAFNSVRVIESMCLRCGRMVGASPSPDMLTVAEDSHFELAHPFDLSELSDDRIDPDEDSCS